MQIRLDELLENMKSDAKDGEEDTGLFDKQEEGPKRVASCPPTPRRKSGVIEAAIDAATQALAEEQSARAAEAENGEPSKSDDGAAVDAPVGVAASEDDDAAENQFDDSDTGRHVEPPPEPRITAERAAIDPEMVTALEAEAAAEEAARAAEAENDEPAVTAADDRSEEETMPERPVKQRTLSQKLAAAAADSEAEHYVEGSLSPLQGKKKGRVEHSGLIDVRQMAAAYLTQNAQDKVEDDEFATGPIPMPIGNESTSPLLLPQRQEAGSNKGLFIALAAVGLLAIIAGTALATSLFIDRGGRAAADMSAAQVAAFCEDEGYVAAVEPRASGSDRVSQAAVALPVDDQPSDSTAADLDQVEVVDEPDGETTDEQAAAGTGDRDSSSRDRDSSSRDRDSSSRDRDSSSRDRDSSSRDRDSSSRDRDSSDRDDSTSASTGSTSTSTPSTAETPKQPAGNVDANGVKCDEVLCLVEGKGCCGKAGAARPGGSTSSNDSAADANLPTRPERGDISSGMDKLQARLQSCGDRFGTRGAVTIKLKIEPSGKVSSASTGAGDGEFQACVSKIVKGAKFPATKQGASVTYPVVLR